MIESVLSGTVDAVTPVGAAGSVETKKTFPVFLLLYLSPMLPVLFNI